jgi:hypothetical protein
MQYVAPTLSPLSPDNACPSYNRLTFDHQANSCQKVSVLEQDPSKPKVYTKKACKWTKGKVVLYADSLKEMAKKIGLEPSSLSKALCSKVLRLVKGGRIELITKEAKK